MALRTEEKTIDGITFKVTQLTAKRSQRLLIKILSMLSSALGKALAGLENVKDVLAADIDFGKVGDAIPAFFSKLTADELESIQRELMQQATFSLPSGQEALLWDNFDLAFEGRPLLALRVTLFAIEVNYGNFSSALAARMGALLQPKASGSPASNTLQATGPSGGL